MKKWIYTLAVGYLYYPHIAMLRLIGPRAAVIASRGIAWLHWCLTFVGVDRRTLRILTLAQPALDTKLGPRSILLRYLITKHQNFTEWYLYPTRRGRRYVQKMVGHIEGREHLDAALEEGNGAILLVFHFGLIKMGLAAVHEAGYDVHQHVFRGKTYRGLTTDWMATAAMQRLAEVDEASGMKQFYHRPMQSLISLVRFLRKGGILGMNGDGMMGEDFVEVPFLGNHIALPLGPAQLAAFSGAPIVPLFAMDEGLFRHRIVLHPPLRVVDESNEQVTRAVREYAALLETYVKKQPWQWWTWRRLAVEQRSDGTKHYGIEAISTQDDQYHYEPINAS